MAILKILIQDSIPYKDYKILCDTFEKLGYDVLLCENGATRIENKNEHEK